MIQKNLHILPLAGGQVIQAANPVTQLQDGFAQVGTNEARTAGDEKQGILGEIQFGIVHITISSKDNPQLQTQPYPAWTSHPPEPSGGCRRRTGRNPQRSDR